MRHYKRCKAVFGALRNVFNLIMHRFDTVYSVGRKIIFLSGITGKKRPGGQVRRERLKLFG